MRWKQTTKLNQGDTRSVRRFVWWPKCLRGQWRWLEMADIRQIVTKYDVGGSMEWGKFRCSWRSYAWDDVCETCEGEGWVVGIEGASAADGMGGSNEIQVACPECRVLEERSDG